MYVSILESGLQFGDGVGEGMGGLKQCTRGSDL